MATAIHSMIRVLDEARSVDFYARAFGLAIADRFAFDGFTLIYLRNAEADFEVELTVNHGRTEPYALGDGYGHIAFAVDDLEAEHARLSALGVVFTMPPTRQPWGGFMALVADPDGNVFYLDQVSRPAAA